MGGLREAAFLTLEGELGVVESEQSQDEVFVVAVPVCSAFERADLVVDSLEGSGGDRLMGLMGPPIFQ